MEEASEPISLVIESWSIAKVALGALLSFAAAYVFKPFFFIARDKMIWAYIRKKILNRKLSKLAHQFASSEALLKHRLILDSESHFHKQPNEFYIGDTQVSCNELKEYESEKKITREVRDKCWLELHELSNRLERITKHFSQEGGDTIDKFVEEKRLTFNAEGRRPLPYKPQGINPEDN